MSSILKSLSMLILALFAVLAAARLSMHLTGFGNWLRLQEVEPQVLAYTIVTGGFVGTLLSWLFSRYYVVHVLRARPLHYPQTAQENWLRETTAYQAHLCGLRAPELAIYDSRDLNAFTTGLSRQQAVVVLSRGLLQSLSQDELEAVLAHEISHIANGDMQLLALCQGVLNSIVVLPARGVGYLTDKLLARRSHADGSGYYLTILLLQLAYGWLASLLVMWFSRCREFHADKRGAKLVGYSKMRSALQCLHAMNATLLPRQLTAFGISGRIGRGVLKLFMSHPSLPERLAALRPAE